LKKIILFLLLVASCFLVAGPANAVLLLQEDFTGASITNAATLTSSSFTDQWIAFSPQRWAITGGSDPFAQHLTPPDGDQTNLLIYGADVSGLGYLASFCLEFDYVLTERVAQVVVAGLPDGSLDEVDPFAGWFSDVGDGLQGFDSNDVPTIWKQGLSLTGAVTHFSITDVVIPKDYDVLAVGFIFGGETGFRGVDNVEFNVKVPEASTMLLLGFGLIGLGGFARRKFKK
jgi:hypothetical protein